MNCARSQPNVWKYSIFHRCGLPLVQCTIMTASIQVSVYWMDQWLLSLCRCIRLLYGAESDSESGADQQIQYCSKMKRWGTSNSLENVCVLWSSATCFTNSFTEKASLSSANKTKQNHNTQTCVFKRWYVTIFAYPTWYTWKRGIRKEKRWEKAREIERDRETSLIDVCLSGSLSVCMQWVRQLAWQLKSRNYGHFRINTKLISITESRTGVLKVHTV